MERNKFTNCRPPSRAVKNRFSEQASQCPPNRVGSSIHPGCFAPSPSPTARTRKDPVRRKSAWGLGANGWRADQRFWGNRSQRNRELGSGSRETGSRKTGNGSLPLFLPVTWSSVFRSAGLMEPRPAFRPEGSARFKLFGKSFENLFPVRVGKAVER
jgi:hypothetical protein